MTRKKEAVGIDVSTPEKRYFHVLLVAEDSILDGIGGVDIALEPQRASERQIDLMWATLWRQLFPHGLFVLDATMGWERCTCMSGRMSFGCCFKKEKQQHGHEHPSNHTSQNLSTRVLRFILTRTVIRKHTDLVTLFLTFFFFFLDITFSNCTTLSIVIEINMTATGAAHIVAVTTW